MIFAKMENKSVFAFRTPAELFEKIEQLMKLNGSKPVELVAEVTNRRVLGDRWQVDRTSRRFYNDAEDRTMLTAWYEKNEEAILKKVASFEAKILAKCEELVRGNPHIGLKWIAHSVGYQKEYVSSVLQNGGWYLDQEERFPSWKKA